MYKVCACVVMAQESLTMDAGRGLTVRRDDGRVVYVRTYKEKKVTAAMGRSSGYGQFVFKEIFNL